MKFKMKGATLPNGKKVGAGFVHSTDEEIEAVNLEIEHSDVLIFEEVKEGGNEFTAVVNNTVIEL